MKRTLFLVATLFVTVTISKAQEATDAKDWLAATIIAYFEQDSYQHFDEIATARYAEYKQDAICVVYECDNSLTKEQCEQKLMT